MHAQTQIEQTIWSKSQIVSNESAGVCVAKFISCGHFLKYSYVHQRTYLISEFTYTNEMYFKNCVQLSLTDSVLS